MSINPSILKVQNALQEAPTSPLSRGRMAVSGHPLRARSAVCVAYSASVRPVGQALEQIRVDCPRHYGRHYSSWPTGTRDPRCAG